MPRASDPRVVVRFSVEGEAVVRAAAESAGVPVAGLVRECAERHAVAVAREIREGRIAPRRRAAEVRRVVAEQSQQVAPPRDERAELEAARLAVGADRVAAFRLMASRRAR